MVSVKKVPNARECFNSFCNCLSSTSTKDNVMASWGEIRVDHSTVKLECNWLMSCFFYSEHSSSKKTAPGTNNVY